MSKTSDRSTPVPPSEPTRSSDSSEPNRHNGLLLASALLATGSVVVAFGYGLQTGLYAVKALGLVAALVAIVYWLALHACRIRRKAAEAQQFAEEAAGTDKREEKPRGWDDAEYEEEYDRYDVAQGALEQARLQHFLFLGLIPLLLVGALTGYHLWAGPGESAEGLSAMAALAIGIVCLAGSCVWLVLARSFGAVAKEELPETASLASASRELQWTTILLAVAMLVSAGLFGVLDSQDATVWAGYVQVWLARLFLVWLLVVCIEHLVRLALAWRRAMEEDVEFVSPVRSVIRDAVFVRGNPIASAFETIEARFGLSFRSSWAIRFVKRAFLPTVLLAFLMFWGLTSLSMVAPSEMGVRESFGRIHGEPLEPGLHVKLPWPFGRVQHFPVKRVMAKPVGFTPPTGLTEADGEEMELPPALLWEKSHAAEEFGLVLGNGGKEQVVIDVLVYYKILEDKQGFLDYVYHFRNAEDALEGYAYRCLTELTRASTLEQVLVTDREKFARDLEKNLQTYLTRNRLGLEVVDVALISLHPPVEVASDYMDTFRAEIDAGRYVIEATGEAAVMEQLALTESASQVADARVEGFGRISRAIQDSKQFIALGEAYSATPESFRLHLRHQTLEEILGKKPFILIDNSFRQGTWIELRGGRSTPYQFKRGEP